MDELRTSINVVAVCRYINQSPTSSISDGVANGLMDFDFIDG